MKQENDRVQQDRILNAFQKLVDHVGVLIRQGDMEYLKQWDVTEQGFRKMGLKEEDITAAASFIENLENRLVTECLMDKLMFLSHNKGSERLRLAFKKAQDITPELLRMPMDTPIHPKEWERYEKAEEARKERWEKIFKEADEKFTRKAIEIKKEFFGIVKSGVVPETYGKPMRRSIIEGSKAKCEGTSFKISSKEIGDAGIQKEKSPVR